MTTVVQILDRTHLGLLPPNERRLSRRPIGNVIGVTVHCTVTPTVAPATTWRQIQAEYMDGHNVNHEVYGDLPYNDGITMDGAIFAGRDHGYVGAHAKSTDNMANNITLGVALIGTGQSISAQAEAALRTWLYLVTLELGRRPILFDHLDWRALGGISTACPDPATVAFVSQLRAEARAGH